MQGVLVNKFYKTQQHTSDLYLGFDKRAIFPEKQLVDYVKWTYLLGYEEELISQHLVLA